MGTRAFDLLLALLEADGFLVTKDELLSRVWPGIHVSEENLKVQILASPPPTPVLLSAEQAKEK